MKDSISCFWGTAGSSWSAWDFILFHFTLILFYCLNCSKSWLAQTHTCCSEDMCNPGIYCLGEDFKIRPLHRINCMSNHRGENFVENKTKAVLQNSFLDAILFSIYVNNIEQVDWSSLSFHWLYHSVFCMHFIVLSYKWAITEF